MAALRSAFSLATRSGFATTRSIATVAAPRARVAFAQGALRNSARFNARRTFASESAGSSSGGSSAWMWILGLGAAAGGGFYIMTQRSGDAALKSKDEPAEPKPLDYQAIYNEIADLLDSNAEYDDGSYGPLLVRLAWHASGTYDEKTKTGGSNGATMRFDPESNHGANAGLQVARQLMDKVKAKFPQISYSDLWTLGGVAAIQEMGGPDVAWRPGRADALSADMCTPDGRLPDASQGSDHLRMIFYKMGMNDQEIVALSGAHALGRCHTERSGYDGPWTFSPTSFTNDYFKKLLEEKWVEKKWKGPKQMIDKATGTLMMLPTDMALTKDKSFRKFVDLYAKDEEKFFADFAKAFQKLEELGVPFKEDNKPMVFKRSSAVA